MSASSNSTIRPTRPHVPGEWRESAVSMGTVTNSAAPNDDASATSAPNDEISAVVDDSDIKEPYCVGHICFRYDPKCRPLRDQRDGPRIEARHRSLLTPEQLTRSAFPYLFTEGAALAGATANEINVVTPSHAVLHHPNINAGLRRSDAAFRRSGINPARVAIARQAAASQYAASQAAASRAAAPPPAPVQTITPFLENLLNSHFATVVRTSSTRIRIAMLITVVGLMLFPASIILIVKSGSMPATGVGIGLAGSGLLLLVGGLIGITKAVNRGANGANGASGAASAASGGAGGNDQERGIATVETNMEMGNTQSESQNTHPGGESRDHIGAVEEQVNESNAAVERTLVVRKENAALVSAEWKPLYS